MIAYTQEEHDRIFYRGETFAIGPGKAVTIYGRIGEPGYGMNVVIKTAHPKDGCRKKITVAVIRRYRAADLTDALQWSKAELVRLDWRTG